METTYKLLCLGCGAMLDERVMRIDGECVDRPALLRAQYSETRFIVDHEAEGLYRYRHWLPIGRILPGSSAPATYRSEGLARYLGLDRLYVTFSGYWPERGVEMRTGTFKECEAYSVCARLPGEFADVLVVASAGNTARAFIDVCSRNTIPLLVVVPQDSLPNIWVDHDIAPCVKIIATRKGSDYFDAIALSRRICTIDGFCAEGGAKNVARRDGMGCTTLSAVEEIGSIPDYYFQAVGSGTGAIAAWEANLRLIGDGRYGDKRMKLMVSQNAPFTPIYSAWKRRSRDIEEFDCETARRYAASLHAKVLSNRMPPYGIVGGLFDALCDTHGDVLAVENAGAERAQRLFEEQEGIDISPAAAVAVASLEDAVREGMVRRDSVIMLNITGGGYNEIKKRSGLRDVVPDAVVDPDSVCGDEIRDITRGLFGLS